MQAVVFFTLAILISSSVLAVEGSYGPAHMEAKSVQTVREGQALPSVDYSMIVDQKLYDGGMDEESLSVQEKLPSPYTTIDLRSVRGDVLEQVIEEEKETDEESSDEDSAEENEGESSEAELPVNEEDGV